MGNKFGCDDSWVRFNLNKGRNEGRKVSCQ
jgi:hypothetical protein